MVPLRVFELTFPTIAPKNQGLPIASTELANFTNTVSRVEKKGEFTFESMIACEISGALATTGCFADFTSNHRQEKKKSAEKQQPCFSACFLRMVMAGLRLGRIPSSDVPLAVSIREFRGS